MKEENLNKLKKYLRLQGLSQSKIAEELNVSQAYVNLLLNGKNNFGIETALKWRDKFGFNPEWLIYETEPMLISDYNKNISNDETDYIGDKQCEIINLSGQMKIAPLIPIDVTRQQNVRIWDFVQRHKDLYDTIPDRLMPNFNLIHIVRSDVLQPAIEKGDILFLDHLELSTDSVVNGHIYFMDTKNNGIVIKRIFVTDNKLTCYSLRKKVPVKTFDLDEIYDIFNIVATLKFSIPNIDDDSEDKVDKLIDANQSVITQNDKLIDELSAQRKLIERLVGKAG